MFCETIVPIFVSVVEVRQVFRALDYKKRDGRCSRRKRKKASLSAEQISLFLLISNGSRTVLIPQAIWEFAKKVSGVTPIEGVQ